MRALPLLLLLAACTSTRTITATLPGPSPAPDLGNVPSLVRMGDQMRNSGDPNSAAGFYLRAKERDPSSPLPHARLGDLSRALGEEAQAEAYYRAALAVDSRSPDAAAGLAAALLAQNRGAEAVALLEPLARSSADPKLLRNYGVALDLAGRQADAQAAYRRGLEATPGDADLRGNLALSLAVSGDTDGALAAMRGTASPAQAPNAVLLLAMAGRDSEARREAVGMAPDERDALLARGRRAAAAQTPADRAAALGVVSAPALSLTRSPTLRVTPAEAPPIVLQAPAQ